MSAILLKTQVLMSKIKNVINLIKRDILKVLLLALNNLLNFEY